MKKKTPEFTQMMGNRFNNDDGFTYVYGRVKHGPVKTTASSDSVKSQIRADKRKVKNREDKRIRKEYEDEQE